MKAEAKSMWYKPMLGTGGMLIVSYFVVTSSMPLWAKIAAPVVMAAGCGYSWLRAARNGV